MLYRRLRRKLLSFDKFYPKRKDRRSKYRDSRAISMSCRAHKSCNYCKNNRLYQYKRELEKSLYSLSLKESEEELLN